jgi:hypothetical protein
MLRRYTRNADMRHLVSQEETNNRSCARLRGRIRLHRVQLLSWNCSLPNL